MTALLILNYDVTDAAGLAAYRERAAPLLSSVATRIAVTPQTQDLGEAHETGTDTVIWAFPDVAAARALYDSAAYQALLADRLSATAPRFAVIVKALEL